MIAKLETIIHLNHGLIDLNRNIIMLGKWKKAFEYWIKKQSFLLHNCGLHVGNTFVVKGTQYIKCGKNVYIGENSKLLCWDSHRGKKFDKAPEIILGNNLHITRNFVIQCANRVEIGNNVLIASDVFIIDYNHGTNPLLESYLYNPLDISEGIVIRDGAWIGNNVIILGGVEIGKKAIIGAGAVVTHSIPDYSIAVGNPARVVKKWDFNINEWIPSNSLHGKPCSYNI